MKTILSIVALCLILSGCTEKQPISPTVTDETSWIPNMEVLNVGYQRVEMELESVPSDQIIRNLALLTIEAQKLGETQFLPLDTLNAIRFVLSSYRSSPRLEQNTDYLVRFSAKYKNGVVRDGNAVSIHSPAVKGAILKQINNPQPLSPSTYFIPTDFTFWEGSLYALYDRTLILVDTATGNWEIVSNAIIPYSHDRLQMTFSQDTLIVASHSTAIDDPISISWIDARTMTIFREAEIYPGTRPDVNDITVKGSDLLMLVQHGESNELRFLTASAHTGEIVNESSGSPGFQSMVLAEEELWVTKSYSYDLRIISKVNQTTFAMEEEHQNPVFTSFYIDWDGANFWVFDYETQTYAKLQLEGI